MTTLLTGASGLVGANLAHLLAQRGEKLRLLLRDRSDRRGLAGLSFEEVRGDLLDPASLGAAMKGVQQVYHAAGAVRFDPFSRQTLARTNVDGTRNVLAAARAACVRRLVHVSSIAAVGHGTLAEPATEESPFNFEGDNPYHASKREAEALALASSDADLEVVVVNPSFVMGAFDVRPTTGEVLRVVASGRISFYPAGGLNVVNATDVADGLVRAMAQGQAGERYILGGENLTYREYLTLIAEEAGVRAPRVLLPDGLFRAVGRVGDQVGRLAPDRFRFLNSPFLRALPMPTYQSSQKAQRALGYRPRPVRLGIRAGLAWFQEHGMLPRDRPLTPRRG